MVYIPKDNTGSLFPNNRKTKDTHPNLTGSLRLGGKDYWLSAWTKLDKNGVKFLSLAIRPKGGATEPSGAVAQTDREALRQSPDLDDPLPF